MARAPEILVDIRCRGCRRLLGIAPRAVRMYCDATCAGDFATSEHEFRDALIEVLFLDENLAKQHVANMVGVTRQRVDQVLEERRKGVY